MAEITHDAGMLVAYAIGLSTERRGVALYLRTIQQRFIVDEISWEDEENYLVYASWDEGSGGQIVFSASDLVAVAVHEL
jgi:hypothetical protein